MARCWCLEWWFDREGAQRKLLAEVDAAVRNEQPPEIENLRLKADTSSSSNSSTPSTFSQEEPASGEGAALAAELAAAHAAPDPDERPYEPAPLDAAPRRAGNFNLIVGPGFVRPQMQRIIDAEGPITEKLLFSRVLEEWGFKEMTESRSKVLKASLPKDRMTTSGTKGKTYWPLGVSPEEWHFYRRPTSNPRSHRDFPEIPMEELSVAYRRTANNLPSNTDNETVFRELLRLFALPPRVTADIRKSLDAARKINVKNVTSNRP